MAYRSRPRRRPARRIRRAARRNPGKVSRSVAGMGHIFKRMTGVVSITNESSSLPHITTICNGWQIGNFAPSIFGTTTQFGLSANFQLRDVIDSTDFTNLFDRYKIIGVKLKFMYQMATGYDQVNPQAPFGPHSQPLPLIDIAFDGDDSDLPVSQTQVQQKGYCKTHTLRGGSSFKTYWKPRVDKLLYGSSIGTSAYTSERACYIDCNSNQVQHFGLKAWITAWPFDTTLAGSTQPCWGSLTVQPTYYVALRDSI